MRSSLLALSLTLATAFSQAQTTKVDTNLPTYKPASGVTGTVTVIGSDTLESIVYTWFSGFRKFHPDVVLKSSAEGSSAGALALLEGDTLIATMSREMSKSETVGFQTKFGYPPTRLVVGLDALTVFVHPTNPIASLTVEQLDSIFSSTRKQGGKDPITTWGALGMTGADWANRKIALFGRDENSGTRVFFRDKVLLKGDFRPGVSILDDATSVLEAVSLNPAGIGYASVADMSSLARTVPIVSSSGAKVLPTADSITKSEYPLIHFLYLYVNKAPGKPMPPAALSFLTYALSKEGQTGVAVGCIPIPADVSKAMLNKIQ